MIQGPKSLQSVQLLQKQRKSIHEVSHVMYSPTITRCRLSSRCCRNTRFGAQIRIHCPPYICLTWILSGCS